MKERWFNFRPLCLIFAFLLIGVVFAFYVTSQLVLCLISAFIIVAFLLFLAIWKKKLYYILIPIIAFSIGIGAYYLAVFSFNQQIDYIPQDIEVRISNVSKPDDGYLRLEGDSCKFDDKEIDDKITILVYDNDSLFENLEIGSVISFTPYKFYHSDLFYRGIPDSSAYAERNKYTVSVLMENITYHYDDKTFAEMIKLKIKDNLEYGLTNENLEIAYSSLFGEKDLLSDRQYSAYKLSGIAHLLAVSGLHVNIIVGILYFFLDRLHIKRWGRLGIVGTFLLGYMYICNFSISVIRASIMSLLYILAKLVHEEYDSFNAISIAGIVIFCINPLCIFDVGFLLSFSCSIGITMLYRPIKKALTYTKAPKAIVDSMAISLATTISTVFIMAYYFQTLNIISIIANVILIPIFTVGFVAIFIGSILSLMIPYITYLLYPVNFVLDFINLVANILGNLAISNFNTLSFNFIAIVLYFILLLFVSRMCTAKYQYRIFTTLPIFALLIICLI
ncbi:MAG: ComEC/Rec2 family competence protein [Clostridiales bacterium]|nr:ComEC/Rec2 family competence protein [Clostridiales bacterium]